MIHVTIGVDKDRAEVRIKSRTRGGWRKDFERFTSDISRFDRVYKDKYWEVTNLKKYPDVSYIKSAMSDRNKQITMTL